MQRSELHFHVFSSFTYNKKKNHNKNLHEVRWKGSLKPMFLGIKWCELTYNLWTVLFYTLSYFSSLFPVVKFLLSDEVCHIHVPLHTVFKLTPVAYGEKIWFLLNIRLLLDLVRAFLFRQCEPLISASKWPFSLRCFSTYCFFIEIFYKDKEIF